MRANGKRLSKGDEDELEKPVALVHFSAAAFLFKGTHRTPIGL